jgi:hypothetical protein
MNILSQSIVWRIYHQGEGSGHSGSEITLGAQATSAQGFAAAEIGEGAASG